MEAELTRKGLWEVVEFEYKVGAFEAETQKAIEVARAARDAQLEKKAWGEIVLHLEADQLVHVQGERDPANMWDQLKAVHMSRGLTTEVTRWRVLLNAEVIGEEVPKKLQAIIAVVGLCEELNMVETKLNAVNRKLWTVKQVVVLALNEEA
ncbi:uncharacterized protein LAESUDRAFT_764557 [Laetiporus sulphureus 93-53]|uniref:Uncharacterized protein n=1 Tax=Laetiporus sulphureus 93-53 TaxID=1314785 RepID=A0A165B8J0_9APHY|nr:uncharacterized protein LAESUDRAFT_764557 [Laetiporus sulphureus 93-53]KZT00490.1 hypothetical protein LAESUDRAFT_764557 [Laetiporus sulphureus 93-53]